MIWRPAWRGSCATVCKGVATLQERPDIELLQVAYYKVIVELPGGPARQSQRPVRRLRGLMISQTVRLQDALSPVASALLSLCDQGHGRRGTGPQRASIQDAGFGCHRSNPRQSWWRAGTQSDSGLGAEPRAFVGDEPAGWRSLSPPTHTRHAVDCGRYRRHRTARRASPRVARRRRRSVPGGRSTHRPGLAGSRVASGIAPSLRTGFLHFRSAPEHARDSTDLSVVCW